MDRKTLKFGSFAMCDRQLQQRHNRPQEQHTKRLRPNLEQTTARNYIATALIHSKLDYCNSLFLNLAANQLDRLQLFLILLFVLSQIFQNFIT
jgi:hypothetical protein